MMTATTFEQNTQLSAAIRLGAVHLTVANLDRSIAFYERVLGLRLHDRSGATAELGAGGARLVVLVEQLGARPVRNHTGLYHFALLTPSRAALAGVLHNLITTQTEFGNSDHLVSEALYLSDPDGNGIEVYRDRPRDEWTWNGNEIVMDSLPLDFRAILAELPAKREPTFTIDRGTVLGHMHLHVAHLDRAVQFYRSVIGMDVMAIWNGSAAFMAAGKYHHHLGLNTWAGVGAPPPPPDAAGLRFWTVYLPAQAERDRLVQRIEAARISWEARDNGVFVRDPFGNAVLFVVDAAS